MKKLDAMMLAQQRCVPDYESNAKPSYLLEEGSLQDDVEEECITIMNKKSQEDVERIFKVHEKELLTKEIV